MRPEDKDRIQTRMIAWRFIPVRAPPDAGSEERLHYARTNAARTVFYGLLEYGIARHVLDTVPVFKDGDYSLEGIATKALGAVILNMPGVLAAIGLVNTISDYMESRR